MSGTIIKHEPVDIYSDELDHPVSITDTDEIATTRDLIVATAPPQVQAAFRSVFGKAMKAIPGRILSANELDTPSLRRVTIEVLGCMNPDEKVGFIPGGSYIKERLIDEVRHGTAVGTCMMDATLQASLLTQKAIETGNIRPRAGSRPPLILPELDC